jgi:hypothetical protein
MLPWALLGLTVFFLLVTYIIVQGSRAAMAWRAAAAAGDLKVIRMIVEDSLSVWRSMKRPKAIPPDVWRGVQSMQLTDLAADFVRVSCQAQSEYLMQDGVWTEVKNPLQQGIEITARAADMLFYEMPHYRPERIQVDVYTAFREGEGPALNVCIMSTAADRDRAREVDWEEWGPGDIADGLGARYRPGEFGQPLPIEVDPPSGLLDEIPEPEQKAARRR